MMTFEEILTAANAGGARAPGQWTPQACRTWREADPEDARLLEACWAWELANDRRVQAKDELAVTERRRTRRWLRHGRTKKGRAAVQGVAEKRMQACSLHFLPRINSALRLCMQCGSDTATPSFGRFLPRLRLPLCGRPSFYTYFRK